MESEQVEQVREEGRFTPLKPYLLGAFRERHKPAQIIHRDEEIAKLKEQLQLFKDGGQISVIVVGQTGLGKTICVTAVLADLASHEFTVVEAVNKSPTAILREITGLRSGSESDAYRAAEERAQKPFLLILDEAHKARRLKYLFNQLNRLHRNSDLSTVVITTEDTFEERIPQDATSTISFERITFKPYNALQIGDILKTRVAESHEDVQAVIPEGRIPLLAANLTMVGGYSARDALTTMHHCLTKGDLSEQFIREFISERFSLGVTNFYEGLTVQKQKVLRTILSCMAENREAQLKISQLKHFDRKRRRDLDGIDDTRLSRIVGEFMKQRIMTATPVYGGKNGNYYLYSFVNEETMHLLLKLSGFVD